MTGRVVLVLMVVALLVSCLITFGLPRPASARDPLPTPAGQLGGRMPLLTAEGLLGRAQPQDTPEPSHHPLVGAWLLTFAGPDQAAAQVVFGDDGLVTFVDAAGNRGAGVWLPSGPQHGVVAVVAREVPVIHVRMEDRPGEAARTSRRLADAGVNIVLWLPVDTSQGSFTVAIGVDDVQAARQALGEQLTDFRYA